MRKISIPSHYTRYVLKYPRKEHYGLIRIQDHIERHSLKYRFATFAVFAGSIALNVFFFDTWKDREYIAPGKAACVHERPTMDYFAMCNPLADGPACTHESRSRMMRYYDGIDSQCRFKVPDRAFRFVVTASSELAAPAPE